VQRAVLQLAGFRRSVAVLSHEDVTAVEDCYAPSCTRRRLFAKKNWGMQATDDDLILNFSAQRGVVGNEQAEQAAPDPHHHFIRNSRPTTTQLPGL
jgi:hypothetical protein